MDDAAERVKPETDAHEPGTISGRWVVLGMFGFAITATVVLYAYWHYHRAPFLPLQKALAEEFPDSAPKVEGGRRKSHKGTPRVLRIIMRADFDPSNADDGRAEAFAERVIEFVRSVQDVSGFDVVQLHLYQLNPEETIREATLETPAASLGPLEERLRREFDEAADPTVHIESLTALTRIPVGREQSANTLTVALRVGFDAEKDKADVKTVTDRATSVVKEFATELRLSRIRVQLLNEEGAAAESDVELQ